MCVSEKPPGPKKMDPELNFDKFGERNSAVREI
jgi:hypothetical protein